MGQDLLLSAHCCGTVCSLSCACHSCFLCLCHACNRNRPSPETYLASMATTSHARALYRTRTPAARFYCTFSGRASIATAPSPIKARRLFPLGGRRAGKGQGTGTFSLRFALCRTHHYTPSSFTHFFAFPTLLCPLYCRLSLYVAPFACLQHRALMAKYEGGGKEGG